MKKKGMVKTEKEIALLREGGKILRETLQAVKDLALEGIRREVPSEELNKLAIKMIEKYGGKPSFLGYRVGGTDKKPILYPSALCISKNEEIVHGIPTKDKVINEGDLLKLDLGVWYKGLCTDSALTVAIGLVSESAQKILETTEKALALGIGEVREGNTLGDYGYVVQKYIEGQGLAVVRGLVGHGVGYAVHEPPHIPNVGRRGEGLVLKEGMVLALEPMVAEFSGEIKSGRDGFAFVTADGGLAGHFEHTVVVRRNGAEVLT